LSEKLGIGIDTGGTFTDACLYDFAAGKVLRRAKARTTYHDLAIGIGEAVAALGPDSFSGVEVISLSTTLATNAILEGRGGREGLILIGYQRELMEQLAPEVGLTLHDQVYFIPGSFDISGNEIVPPDLEQARQAILSMQDEVEAIGISGYLSVVNPAHELAVAELACRLSSLPVTCGHELTNEMHSVKRAATVALNARLIPIIRQLISSVEEALRRHGLKAPLMIVQGDGSLVRAEAALQRPVQTILSGPAASCIGGATLSEVPDCIIVDTGGTSTDIALLRGGRPQLNPKGTAVGKWRTSVAAVKARTTALGGDSHVKISRQLSIEIGPQRVVPLCAAAAEYPQMLPEIERLAAADKGLPLTQLFDFLLLQKPQAAERLSGGDRHLAGDHHRTAEDRRWAGDGHLFETLAQAGGPLSLSQLAAALNISHPYLLDTTRWEQLGIIQRIGLTPTDILHAAGLLRLWDPAPARLATAATAEMLSMTSEEFVSTVREMISRRLALEILTKLLESGGGLEIPPHRLPGLPDQLPGRGGLTHHPAHQLTGLEAVCAALIDLGLGTSSPEQYGGLHCRFSLHYPLVALGAPGGVYLERTAEMLGAKLMVPSLADVAGAIGAVTSNVVCSATCTVMPEYSTAGIMHYYLTGLATENGKYKGLPEALAAAEALAAQEATKRAKAAGAGEVQLKVEQRTVGTTVHLATHVTVTAIGSALYD